MVKQKLVVLTGAGISAESGIQTFRDSDGLWENHRIEEVATPGAWKRNPQLVLDFYNLRRRNILAAQPNAAHLGIAALQKHFEVQVITQNIDDLHERAGSKNVLHLHGSIFERRSEKNETLVYPIKEDMKLDEMAEDGGRFRPNIVWFEEPVPMIEIAIPMIEAATIFVLIGSSMLVYPAAGLMNFLSPNVPKYVIDKQIPSLSHSDIIPIQMPATEGVKELEKWLMASKH
ncbi:MAG TPA: Sir2 family NAD-dependent protein deacetylase [Flavipsychrobacter sp.]|nr:Sir2 family NAD-dependent protein deacetylase [Flavipsychrobacter sp.]